MTKGELDAIRARTKRARALAKQGRTLDGALVSQVSRTEFVDSSNPNKTPAKVRNVGKKRLA